MVTIAGRLRSSGQKESCSIQKRELFMRVHVQSEFQASADRVWRKVQTVGLLMSVMRPLVRIAVTTDGYPERWTPGKELCGRLYLFVWLPLGPHAIGIESVDDTRMQIMTREHGLLAPSWDHLIAVRSTPAGETIYSDTIDIRAGLLTPMLWLFANVFYRHRHCRWKRLLRG
jgi:hypothetical protein